MKKLATVLVAGISVLCLVFLVGAIYFIAWAQKPLGPSLELNVPPALLAEDAAMSKPQTLLLNQTQACGASGIMKLILIGVNGPVGIGHNGADAFRLVVIDFDEVEASILALPEDLWVDTPEDFVDDLGPQAPLNLIYRHVLETGTGNPEDITRAATQVVTQVIVDTFEFVPQEYANLSGESFVELIDDLGGVSFTLESAVDGTAEAYGIFPQGVNELNGLRTLDFVRVLFPQGVPGPDYFGRFERQNTVILAIFRSLIKPENWGKLPAVYEDLQKLIVTNLSVGQMRALACMLEKVGDQAYLVDVGEEQVHFDEQGRMFPDVEEIKDLIAKMDEPGY
jgi:anionic cell wall polymer biosynthesis LytR-Cps2A-Psr (LCP) family protein